MNINAATNIEELQTIYRNYKKKFTLDEGTLRGIIRAIRNEEAAIKLKKINLKKLHKEKAAIMETLKGKDLAGVRELISKRVMALEFKDS